MLNSIKNEIDMREFANEEFMMPSSPSSEKEAPAATVHPKGSTETHRPINKKAAKPQSFGQHLEFVDAATFRQSDGIQQSYLNCFGMRAEER